MDAVSTPVPILFKAVPVLSTVFSITSPKVSMVFTVILPVLSIILITALPALSIVLIITLPFSSVVLEEVESPLNETPFAFVVPEPPLPPQVEHTLLQSPAQLGQVGQTGGTTSVFKI